MQKINNHIPWVEKYRPSSFNDIVLSDINKTIFENILKDNYFPNLLFFGPPGTGKTTTIINLINAYQEKNNEKKKGLMIHLNASDERGIDIVRNNINNFVNSKNLFNKGTKFIILDEVDYMTKNAQQALKYLLEINNGNVRFCLICNYISKVDTSLKNEFLCIRFNQLPKDKTIVFLKNIAEKEEVSINNDGYEALLDMYKSDIRSMINFMQLNKDSINLDNVTLSNVIMDDILEKIKHSTNYKNIINLLHDISIQYNYDKKTIIKKLLNYIIRYKTKYINEDFLILCKTVLHENDLETYNMIKFVVLNLNSLIH